MTVALRFIAALDAADWDGLRALLADSCTYAVRGQLLEGPEAIVASYRSVEDWVRETFDEVRYDSEVLAHDEHTARVGFRDRLRYGERRLDFRCEQHLRIDDGLVAHIEHVDLPGEREKAERFNRACGLTKEAPLAVQPDEARDETTPPR